MNSKLLLETIKFAEPAQNDVGEPYKCHLKIQDGFMVATNAVMTVGIAIDMKVNCCPHTGKLIAALSKCKDEFRIKQTDSKRLQVVSGKMKAFVPCIPDPSMIPSVQPDPIAGVVDNRLKESFLTVAPIVADAAEQPLLFSVLIDSCSCIGTNSRVTLEHYHGIDLPRLLIPKKAALILGNVKKDMVKFGFSANSVTFYFEDGSWIKTQLSNDDGKDISTYLKYDAETEPVNAAIFEGLDVVLPFSEHGLVYLSEDSIRSHLPGDDSGAQFDLKGTEFPTMFNGRDLKSIQKYAETIHFGETKTHFFSGMCRGLIMNRRVK